MIIKNAANSFDLIERTHIDNTAPFDINVKVDRKVISKCCYSIIQIIRGNQDISVVSDLSIERVSDVDKIKFFVDRIQAFYKLDYIQALSSIARLKCRVTHLNDEDIDTGFSVTVAFGKSSNFGEFFFVKQLVRFICRELTEDHTAIAPEESKFLALKTLELLGRIDQRVDLVFCQCAKFLQTNSPNVKRGLELWCDNSPPFLIYKEIKPRVAEPASLRKMLPMEQDEWRIRKIFLGTNSRSFVQNFEEVGEKEGFTLETPFWNNEEESIAWLRDMVLLTPSGRILIPKIVTFDEEFWDTHNSFYSALGGDWLMGEVVLYPDSLEKLREIGAEEASVYYEGGNLTLGRNQKGKLFYLSGQGNLQMSFILHAERLIHENLQGLQEKWRAFTPEESQEIFQEAMVFMQPALIRSGIIAKFANVSFYDIVIAAVLGLRQLRAEFMNELQLPTLFLGPPYELQAEFHIDLFVIPAPNGMVFVQDYSQTVAILEELLSEDHWSFEKRDNLEEYLTKAKLMEQKYQQQIKHIGAQLQLSDFKVCYVPGLYHLNLVEGDDNSSVAKAAYINCIFGLDAQNEIYCISMGSVSHFESYFEKKFAESLHSYGVKKVYFLGRPTVGEVSYAGGLPYVYANEKLWRDGGIHCISLEITDLHPEGTEEKLLQFLEELNMHELDKGAAAMQLINGGSLGGTVTDGLSSISEGSSVDESSDGSDEDDS